MMVEGWRAAAISAELYCACRKEWDKNKAKYKLHYGIRSPTAFINYCLREQLKKIGAV